MLIPFIKLPLWGKSVLLIGLFLLLIVQLTGVYLTIRGANTRKNVLLLIQTAVTMLLLSVLAEGNIGLVMQQKLSKLTVYEMYGMKIPVILIILYEGISAIYILNTILAEYEIQKSQINKGTIKESADTLPMGLCFARLNGHPYLVNKKMNELSNLLRGKSLQNQESFWNDLLKGEFLGDAKKLSSDKNPVVLLEDGTVWVFRQEVIQIQGKNAIQMTAADSTQLYKLYDKLQIKNQDLEIVNQKLREYGNQIEGLTKAQERLSLKMRIHDAIGQNLIATKYFLLQGSADGRQEDREKLQRYKEKLQEDGEKLQEHSEKPEENRKKWQNRIEKLEEDGRKLQKQREKDIAQILKKWEHAVAMLRHEIQEKEESDALQYLTDAAQSAGVQILVEGRMPQSTREQEMIVVAGAEALTNAVRHARADKLWITISENSDGYIIDFKNKENENHKIQEGGGLSSLRKRVENMGGSMKIIADTDFILKIILPKRERGDFL